MNDVNYDHIAIRENLKDPPPELKFRVWRQDAPLQVKIQGKLYNGVHDVVFFVKLKLWIFRRERRIK